jgi:cytidylate kinase
MKTKSRSIQQIIEEQMQRWQIMRTKKVGKKPDIPIITISREPGSGGRVLATKIAEKFDLDVFHNEVLHEIARRADVSAKLLETLDEKGLNVLEDWISSLVYDRHLWPDEYLQHLMKVIAAIGKHGRAIIIGRGANFVLPPENRLRLRIIAPREIRIENVARTFKVSAEDAKRRVIRTESDRRAFVRKYFNADIADPVNYDLIINTSSLGMDNAVRAAFALLRPYIQKFDEESV